MNDIEELESQPEVAPPPTSIVDRNIGWIQADIDRLTLAISWLKSNREQIERLGIVPFAYNGQMDFNNPTRSQILEIIKAFPGKWQKSVCAAEPTKMDYTREIPGEMTLRIWGGELPPCCQLVEEWVDVPAQPATRVLKKVVKCPEPMPENEVPA